MHTQFPLPRWAAAARAYLEAGHAFLGGCMQTGSIERMAVEGLDAMRRGLEEQDGQYNAVLDKLEVRWCCRV